jgi:predicted TIM-barrel fold metal-dependent hydrolase
MLSDVNFLLRTRSLRAAHVAAAGPGTRRNVYFERRGLETESEGAHHMRWNHPIIDADQHINEPLDLWEEYLPKKFQDRRPRVVEFEFAGRKQRGWKFDADDKPTPFLILNNGAGISPLEWANGADGYAQGRKGAGDPVARISDMDIDGVDAAVLFPSYVMGGSRVYSKDAAVQVACTQAYNNWHSDFCSHDPDRLWGLAMIPMTGVDDAVTELKRVRELAGIRGVLLAAWPSGSITSPDHAADERFWAAAADLDLPVIVHVGFFEGLDPEAVDDGPAGGSGQPPDFISLGAMIRTGEFMMPVLSNLMAAGILDRHPGLRWGMAEAGAGWIPFFLEQFDQVWLHHRFGFGKSSPSSAYRYPPSELWCRQGFAAMMRDKYAVAHWDDPALIDSLCWSSDFPHTLTPWPDSRLDIADQFGHLPEEARRKFLYKNAARLYGVKLAD